MEIFLEFEKAALTSIHQYEFSEKLNRSTSTGQIEETIGELLKLVASGSYVEALKTKELIDVLSSDINTRPAETSIEDYFENTLTAYLDTSNSSKEIIVHCLGICCLQLFTQNNFCGPLIGPNPASVIPGFVPHSSNGDAVRLEALKELVLDTEGIYSLLHGPEFLILSRVIFYKLKNKLSSCKSVNWWCFRYGIIHQKIGDEHSPILYETLIESLNAIENNSTLLNEHRSIAASFHLEAGHLYLQYYDVAKASSHFQQVFSILGLEVTLTGAMGKRTKWQQHDLPQLVVKVSYTDKPLREDELPGPSLLPSDLPKDVLLNDDTRLHRVNYRDVDEDAIPKLQPVEQMALLAHIILKRKSQATDIQLNLETKAYLSALLQHPKNWAVQMSALVMRSRVESGEFRTMERSMNQFEELVNAVVREEPSRHERLKLIYSSSLMTHWNVQQELARMFMKLGCIKTALELFERLHLWEDVIICYNALQMRQRSAEVITKLMEKEETPKLWCLLGDATDDIECYNKAWELSNHKSGRAQRCLANFYYVRREYSKAIEHFELSVKINSLQFPVWQRMAYCFLQIEDWEKCAKAYGRCSILEPDNFECWNNMSQAYLKMGHTQRAWKTLQEAFRCNRDSWHLWRNYMLVSTSLGYMNQALYAYDQILQCHKEIHVDTEILGRIVNAIIENRTDPDGHEMKNLHEECTDLLKKLTLEVTNHSELPDLWFLYAEMLYSHPEQKENKKQIAMDCFQKSVAEDLKGCKWENNSDIACLMLMRLLRLMSVAKEVGKESNAKTAFADLSSIRMFVTNVVESLKKSQTRIDTGEVIDQVKVPLKEVEVSMEIINNFINQLRSSVS